MVCIGSIALGAPVSAPKNPFSIGDLTRTLKTELIAYQGNTIGQMAGRIAVNDKNQAITAIIGATGQYDKVLDKERLKGQIINASAVYGIDPVKIIKTIECESNFNRWAVGDNGAAVSVAQYHWSTFQRYCHGNYWVAEDQIECAVRMIAEGGARNWTCYTKLFGE